MTNETVPGVTPCAEDIARHLADLGEIAKRNGYEACVVLLVRPRDCDMHVLPVLGNISYDDAMLVCTFGAQAIYNHLQRSCDSDASGAVTN